MSVDGGSVDRREGHAPGGTNGFVSGVAAAASNQRLRLNPSKDHKPESYEDLQLDFSPSIFSSLERYLPTNLLTVPRDDKVKFMREILLKYFPHGERNRVRQLYFFFSKFGLWCLVAENSTENDGKLNQY